MPDGWHILDLGLEKRIAIRDDIFDRFNYFARPFPIKDFGLFDRWQIAIGLALREE